MRVTKPHFQIRPGDQVSFMRHRQLIHVEMRETGTRRGPATEARSLYIDLSSPDGSQSPGEPEGPVDASVPDTEEDPDG